jgi:cation diffusion facilitator CzcD-associated flavoprotein CzcO
MSAPLDSTVGPRVLVLGGGFAGIGAARTLKKSDVDIVIVDWAGAGMTHEREARITVET